MIYHISLCGAALLMSNTSTAAGLLHCVRMTVECVHVCVPSLCTVRPYALTYAWLQRIVFFISSLCPDRGCTYRLYVPTGTAHIVCLSRQGLHISSVCLSVCPDRDCTYRLSVPTGTAQIVSMSRQGLTDQCQCEQHRLTRNSAKGKILKQEMQLTFLTLTLKCIARDSRAAMHAARLHPGVQSGCTPGCRATVCAEIAVMFLPPFG